jgi:CysZ protein
MRVIHRYMVPALILTLQQLGDRAILAVLAKSLMVTLGLFAAFGVALVYFVQVVSARQGWDETAGTAATIGATLGALAATWLLFRALAVPVIGFFADQVVVAIEARHYPAALASAKPVAFSRSVALGLRSVLRVLVANGVLIPVYLVLIITGIGPILLFAAINAILLGRDLGEMVAARHLSGSEMAPWLRASRGSRASAGLIVTALFTIPVVNLLAPIIGAGLVTHLYHRKGFW